MYTKERFRNRAIIARYQAKLTQQQLANILGIKTGRVADWEAGRGSPDPDMLGRLCSALGVSADYLTGRDPL